MNMKCRIWDTQNNRFWTDVNEAYKGRIEQLLLSPSGDLNLRTMDGITHESLFPGRFIKSWYTGFQDKNGKDIYDRDEVRFRKFMTEYTGVVRFEKGCFIVKWESVVGAYGEKATHSEYLENCEKIEVIGNPLEGRE